ncbi:MAG: tripartite tricarboxylate transporter TctB family protein [Betaproteobacteria bacterium]|nr:tripartite tricarboxylate transporter TctB family protein [Betaproteobacteria bacterium]
MRFRIKNQEDFWSGLMFINFGVLAIIVARDYPMGAAMRMGPGYFPTYVGALLAGLGAVICVRSLRREGERIVGWAWRPLIMLSVAFLVYGFLMEDRGLGFVPALVALIVLSSLSRREFKPVELTILTVALVAGAVGIFSYGLELPFPLFWWR